MNENPLVSVVVLTYNSSNTVLETLDSIAAQTYKNIELIISDDCSKDDTVKVCEEWLEKNKCNFVKYRIITISKNTGVSGNANRAYKAASGSWIKVVAGDDILLPECVESNVNYISIHQDAQLVFSKIIPFGSLDYTNSYFYKVFLFGYGCMQMSDREFLYLICLSNFIPASTSFMSKSLFIELGGFDESIPMLEDWPFWIKASSHGVHFHFMPIYTVKYRMLDTSLSIGNNSSVYKLNSLKAIKYAQGIQKRTNILLWFYGYCDKKRISTNRLVSIVAFCGKIINPISYYVKFLHYKAKRLSRPFL